MFLKRWLMLLAGCVLFFEAARAQVPGHADTAKIQKDSVKQLKDVMVTAKRLKKDQLNVVVSDTVGGKALEKIPGLSPGKSLKSIAGVNSLQTGPSISKPVIHGVYSNRILILNNGVRQEGQNWGNDHAPEIDPFIATKLSVIKGAASLRYGSDAVGGVVLVDPKEMPGNGGAGCTTGI